MRLFFQALRLNRAVQVLLEDLDSHRALGEVAKRHGFPTSAHFSRLFAKWFGMPPGWYCEQVQAGDTTWLAAQFECTRFPSDLPAAWCNLGARQVPG